QNVVPVLFEYVCDTVSKNKGRRLRYTDLALLFANASKKEVIKSDYDRFRRFEKTGVSIIGQLTDIDVASYASTVFQIQSNLIFPILRPDEKWAQRPQIVSVLKARIEKQSILVLKGLTGMGKSTLASFLALSIDGKWQVLDFRGSDSSFIKASLNHISMQHRINNQTINYIVDDLNFDRVVATYENALLVFLETVRAQGGRVIITTQGDLPLHITAHLGISKDNIYLVPSFEEDEIKVLLSNYGCTSSKLVDSWSRIISLKTFGHPILVHAYVKKLESEGWPNPKIEDLFNNKDFEEIRREARSWFPSQEAQLLAYRLSLLT